MVGASTAEAVRQVAGHEGPWAALGNRLAAERYGCRVLRAGVEDVADNETRFVWLGPVGAPPGGPATTAAPTLGPWKTAIVFWGIGSEAPGWLVACLSEFAEPRGQPDADRVAAAQAGARALHVLLRPRGAGHRATRLRWAGGARVACRNVACARVVPCGCLGRARPWVIATLRPRREC